MADSNTSLPVRTEANGDVAAKIVDGTIPSQALTVNADGSINVTDNGGSLTVDGTVNASNFPATVDVNFGTVGVNTLRAAAEIGNATGAADFGAGASGAQTLRVEANQGAPNSLANGWPVKPTDGTNSQSYTAAGEAKVDITQPLPAGTNLIGEVKARLEDGAGTAITSQANGGQQALDVGINVGGVQIDPRQIRALTSSDVVTVDQGTSPWISKDQSDGPVAPGTVASFSSLAGGQYNSTPPTLTNGQQAALQVDSSGKLLTVSVSSDDHNYGAVGAATLRTAAQIGNASGAADFNNGATGAQTLRVAANLAVAGANVSSTNPVPVTLSAAPLGTAVDDYNTNAALAAGGTSNHDYTVTALKTLLLKQIEASGSGKMKIEVRIETGVATGVFNTKFVQFNSTATPNMSIDLQDPISVAAGVRVRVIRTNRDNQSQDVYSTICGQEV